MNEVEQGIAPGAHGRARLRLVQMHRLIMFEEVFSDYLEGKATAERVRERARKMLAVGLPEFALPRKKK